MLESRTPSWKREKPVQQRLGRAGELRVRQAQARPCVRPRASAVHAQRTRPAARSVLFAAAEEWERSPVRPWASAKYFTLLKWFKISGPNTPPRPVCNPKLGLHTVWLGPCILYDEISRPDHDIKSVET